MNIEHPPAMHHKRWWYDYCHRAETRRHSIKTTQRHCGQVERPTSNNGFEGIQVFSPRRRFILFMEKL